MTEREVTVALVALGGYGNFYLRALLGEGAAHHVRLVAGIDPNPVGCRHLDELKAAGIPLYPNLDAFYAEGAADLVMIAAPIHLHLPFTLNALAHGASVLCEKPLTGTIQEARQMAEAAQQYPQQFVGIAYQWSFSETMQTLKKDILAGKLGRPLRLRTKVLWPRAASYYTRNAWAARLKASNGAWILDSPAQNATAHYLHNCFYILGATRETSAWPVDVQAELYRANPVENYDTAAIRCHTTDGVEILFYTAHPVPNTIGPILSYEFEDGVVAYTAYTGTVGAHFRDGSTKDYGNPYANDASKLWQAADAVRYGMEVAPPACSIAGATPHVLSVNGAQESMWDIAEFPPDLLRYRQEKEDDVLTWMEGLQEALVSSYDRGCLPSELPGVGWAKAGTVVDLRNYHHFPTYHA